MGRDEETLAAAAHHALVAVDVRRHDRGSRGHRLQQDDPEGFPAGRRGHEDIRGPEQLGLLVIGDATQELHAGQAAGGHVAARLALLGAAADHQQAALAAGLAHDAVRLEQVQEALPRLEPADEQEVARPVLPARKGHRAAEPLRVHAVGDHLVVAREVAIDEVAGRGGYRDAPVEPVRVRAHGPAAELVGRRPAPVGVERGHVHAPRLAQDHERQERHERLVEVEDVEPLALQHGAHLGDVARRERDRPHRPVRRHREALAQADDVALGAALQAVGRGQDPDVVPAKTQVLVEVPDVLGHAAGQRVDVR